jgi:hypothetical protein
MRKNQLEEVSSIGDFFGLLALWALRGTGELALIEEEDAWHDGEDGEGAYRVKSSV